MNLEAVLNAGKQWSKRMSLSDVRMQLAQNPTGLCLIKRSCLDEPGRNYFIRSIDGIDLEERTVSFSSETSSAHKIPFDRDFFNAYCIFGAQKKDYLSSQAELHETNIDRNRILYRNEKLIELWFHDLMEIHATKPQNPILVRPTATRFGAYTVALAISVLSGMVLATIESRPDLYEARQHTKIHADYSNFKLEEIQRVLTSYSGRKILHDEHLPQIASTRDAVLQSNLPIYVATSEDIDYKVWYNTGLEHGEENFTLISPGAIQTHGFDYRTLLTDLLNLTTAGNYRNWSSNQKYQYFEVDNASLSRTPVSGQRYRYTKILFPIRLSTLFKEARRASKDHEPLQRERDDARAHCELMLRYEPDFRVSEHGVNLPPELLEYETARFNREQ